MKLDLALQRVPDISCRYAGFAAILLGICILQAPEQQMASHILPETVRRGNDQVLDVAALVDIATNHIGLSLLFFRIRDLQQSLQHTLGSNMFPFPGRAFDAEMKQTPAQISGRSEPLVQPNFYANVCNNRFAKSIDEIGIALRQRLMTFFVKPALANNLLSMDLIAKQLEGRDSDEKLRHAVQLLADRHEEINQLRSRISALAENSMHSIAGERAMF